MYVKNIRFERTGGFAGIRLAANVDVNNLPDDQKFEIINLIDEMDFDELPEKLKSSQVIPDDFVYSVTVETNDNDYTVTSGKTSLPDEMQSLIEILERIAKKQARSH